MTTTQIDYPNCIINIQDESGNYTILKNDPSTLGGLKIFTQNGEGGNNTIEVTSNSINLSTVYPDDSILYRELGFSNLLSHTNEIGETKQGIFSNNNLNYNNNQDGNNLNMFYRGTGIETNNAYSIVSTDSLSVDAPTIDISGQSSFNQPPHSVDPIYGNDLATKGYVDSLVGQYSGGYNLFFNYSVTDSSFSSYKQLGQSVINTTQQTVDIHTNSGPVLVAQFITLPLGITEIPAGLWNTWIYGAVNHTNGELQYYFTLLKFDGTTETLISTSSLSPDVNASPNNNPDSYHMNATISTAYSINVTDRVVIKLYVQKIGGTSVTIRTFFQNSYYSFTQSTLNAGTTLLSSNNTWIGTNTYPLGITTPSISNTTTLSLGTSGQTTNLQGNLQIAGSAGSSGQVLTSDGTTATWSTPTSSQWVNDATSDLSMNTYTIHTNTIYPNTNNSTLNIASNASRSGTLNIQTSSTTTNAINIGSSTSTTTLGGTFLTNSIDALTGGNTLLIGNTNANGVTIGKINQATNISGNLQIAGSAGSSGQVLTSNGTTATWSTLTSNSWVNTATSDLNMSIYAIHTDAINPNNVSSNLNIALGTGRSGQVNIQTTATGTNTINIGSDNSTTNIKGLKTSSIDTGTSEALTIGSTNASSVTIGKSAIQTTINGTLEALTSTINTIQGNGANTTINSYIDNVGGTANMFTNSSRSGTLNIQSGSTSANTVNIGSATTTTNVYGLKTPSIDTITSTTLNIGNTTATGVTIGRMNQTTNISGNLQIAGSAGSSGQVLTSNGTTAAWTTITSGWVNTATSNLNMANYSINNISSIDSSNSQLYIGNASATGITIGKTGITTRINGNVSTSNVSLTNLYIDNTVNFNTASNRNVVLKNDSNIDEILSITKLLNTKNYAFNIEYQKIKINDSTINSGNNNDYYSVEIAPSQCIFTYQNPGTLYYTVFNNGGFYTTFGSTVTTTINYFKLESLNAYSFTSNVSFTMKAPNIYILGATQIDASNTQLSIGNTSATGVLIGRSGQTTNLQGNLQVDGSAGSSGQVLTSNGTTASWTTPSSGWSGTASSTLDMANYSIINASSIDTNNLSLKLGNTSASGVIIGRSGQITNLQGNLQIAGSAGSSGQVLTSDGTSASWATPTSGWNGTATSTLNMSTYAVNVDTINPINVSSNLNIALGTDRTGQVNIQTTATSANTINIGSNTTTTVIKGLKTSSIDTNVSEPLTIGTTTTSGITIGKSGIQVIVPGYLLPSTFGVNSISVIGEGSSMTLWSGSITGTANILGSSTRTGITNIQTGSTSANTINIGSNTTTTVIKGLKTSSIDTNVSEPLTIGTTTTSGITIGKSGIHVNVPGYLLPSTFGVNSISVIGEGSSMTLWSGSITGTANILGSSTRTGITNIQTGSTSSNTINIGSTTTTTNLNGSVIFNNNVSIKDLDIYGSLKITGSAGSSGQVLTSNGTTASWTTITSGWVNEATSDLNMSNFSIKVDTINPTTTSSNLNIALGTGRSGQVNIQTTATGANTINIGSDNSTTNIKGLKTSSIDTATSEPLTIGSTNATGITIGNSGITTTITGLQAVTQTSNNINSNGVGTTNSLWSTLETGTANILTGMTSGTTNVLTNVSRTGITNIQTGSTSVNTINIGSSTTTTNISGSVIIRNGIIAASLDATDTNNPILNIGTNNLSNIFIGNSNVNTYITGGRAQSLISNSISTYGGATGGNLWNNVSTATCNILTSSLRAGITNIQTGSTSANTINIGSSTTTTNISGVVNVSTIKNCSFIDNEGSLVIGNTSSTGITIGRSGQTTNIQGNLQIAGSAGSNGQVLRSNGTTASWASPAWVGTATSNLSMTNNIITITNTSTITENTYPTTPQVDGILIKSSYDSTTRTILQDTGLSVYSNGYLNAVLYKNRLGILDTASITQTSYYGIYLECQTFGSTYVDYPYYLGVNGILLKNSANLAKYDQTGITFGNFQSGNIGSINYSSYNTKINTSQIISTQPYTIQNSSTLTINASTVNIRISGSLGTNGQVLTSNGTTTTWQTPSSGWNGTATSDLTMGIYKLKTNEIDLNSTGNTDYKLFFSAASTDEIYLGSYDVANTANILIGKGNQPIYIGTSTGRTTTIDIGNYATGANYINIGSTTSINTLQGSTLNLNSTGGNVNIGTSGSGTISIGNGTSTALNIGEPITPTYSYNTSTTGTNIVGTIGNILTVAGSAVTSISTSAQTVISTLTITSIGVYMISAYISLGSSTAGTNDRLRIYIGYGASNNTLNNVYAYNIPKLTLGNTIATGNAFSDVLCFPYTITSIASPNNFLTLSAQNTGTSTLPLSPGGTYIQAVRIA